MLWVNPERYKTMKKTNFKINQTKLIARMMLIVLLCTNTFLLNSCSSIGFSEETLNSHKEFVEFVETFNSQNDGTVSTFISFDFDKNNQIKSKSYKYHLEIRRYAYMDTGEYDKYTEQAIIWMYFYLDDKKESITENEYQIMCVYSAKDFNFYQNDNFKLIHADGEQRDTVFKQSHSENLNYYVHTQKYTMSTDGKDIMSIYISSIAEPTQEKLDEISQLLMDNIVIINTEG